MSGPEYDKEKLKRLIRQGRQMQELNDAIRDAQREVDAEDGPAPRPVPAPAGGGVIRRPPGRPAWTLQRFHAAYREALDRCAVDAGDKEIAAAMHRSYDTFRKLVKRFGRPA